MIGSVKLHYKIQKKNKNKKKQHCWPRSLGVTRNYIRKPKSYWKKGLLDKSIEEDEVKEDHVKLWPGGRKHEALSWNK